MSSRNELVDSPSRGTAWIALVAYSLVVCVLHFGGMAYGVYTTVWWWDLLTHSMSGFGVAAWLSFVRFSPFESNQVIALPLAVFCIGVGFEVYEYLFRDFYVEWTLAYYVTDTVIDVVVNGLSATAFGLWYRAEYGADEVEAAVPTRSSR